MEYHSIRQLEELCKTEQKPVWKIVLKAEQTETDETEKQIFERMRQMYHEMKAADEGYAAELRSASGMAGGDGEKMHRFNVTGKNLCSGYMALAMEKALKMGESNACMKRIVAAPTAGSCGVIPAVLISYEEIRQQLHTASRVSIDVKSCDMVSGVISARVTEDFVLPGGFHKSIACDKTILVETEVIEEETETEEIWPQEEEV